MQGPSFLAGGSGGILLAWYTKTVVDTYDKKLTMCTVMSITLQRKYSDLEIEHFGLI